MIALSENPAVLDPKKTLSRNQQDALGAIGFYRYQDRIVGEGWRIGNKRFAASTITTLERHGLVKVRPGGPPAGRIQLTQAGSVAIERLKKGGTK